LAAFRASGTESVKDMIEISRNIQTNIRSMLMMQTDKNFLSSKRLIPLPKIVRGPLVTKNSNGKQFLIAENSAHCRETNIGYSRKANGTFYNH
jgi:hypothetical protein